MEMVQAPKFKFWKSYLKKEPPHHFSMIAVAD
jgi:hypothetical protein